MSKLKGSFFTGALFFSGVVMACATLSMPVPRVNVSIWNLLVATFQGQSNPAQAAFLSNLDAAGEEAVGAAAWRENQYVGEVLVTTSFGGATGGNLQFVDKPCDKKAIDLLPAQASSGGGGTSGNFINSNQSIGYFRPIYQRATTVTTVNGVAITSSEWVLVGYEWVPARGPGYNNHER
jgi:hypothetical protein